MVTASASVWAIADSTISSSGIDIDEPSELSGITRQPDDDVSGEASVLAASDPASGMRLEVPWEGGIPPWLHSFVQTAVGLLQLPDDWDSCGASMIDRFAVETAIEILRLVAQPGMPSPSVVPTSHGGVQVEWHQSGIDLEVEVRSDGTSHIYFFDARTNHEWEAELRANMKPLVDAIAELAARS